MGFVFTIIASFMLGLLFLAGWASFDAVCDCAHLSERVANGTLGLFCVGGAVLSGVFTVLWG